jgi:hypothetical protein
MVRACTVESINITTPLELEEKVMKRASFVPSADLLETRIALSGGVHFTSTGAAILTTRALNQTYSQIQKAFIQFANHGQNYQTLQVNLANAVSRIPWNRRDGLLAAVETAPSALRSDISSGLSKPVMTEMQNTLAEVKQFVQGEVANGIIAVRSR